MEQLAKTAPSNFLEGTSIQYAWDATSMSYFQACPRKYQYTIIEGWRKRDQSVHLWFGGHFASALETYHKLRAADESYTHDVALDMVVDRLLIATWDANMAAPIDFENTPKSRANLLRTVIWYLEEYENDVAETVILPNGKPAVELSFRFELPHVAPNGEPYLWLGHLDRLVRFGTETYVQDQKTTGSAVSSYFFRQFNPSNQMTGYTVASKIVFNTRVSGVMIDAAQIAVGFTAFGRGLTMRTEAQLDEWVSGLGTWFGLAELYGKNKFWPMNLESCGNYGGCPFRGVCSSDPAIRDSVLKTEFEQKPRWNPLEER